MLKLPHVLLACLLAILALVLPSPSRAAALARAGETIGGVEVLKTIDHPEFHRILVQLADGRELTIEVVSTEEPRGACTHHGFAVQPRWELLGEPNQTVEDQPPVVTELCARLAAQPPTFGLAPPGSTASPEHAEHTDEPEVSSNREGPESWTEFKAPEHPPTEPFGLLHGVLALLGLSLVGSGIGLWRALQAAPSGSDTPRASSELATLTVIAVFLRVVFGLWAPLWAPIFGFGRLAAVLSTGAMSSTYGSGYVTTMRTFTAILGNSAQSVMVANLLIGAALPALVWGIVRVLFPERKLAPFAAGLLAAMMPVHVWQSATEVMHVSLVSYEALSVLCAGLFARHAAQHRLVGSGFALAAGLAAIMAVHTRPEAIPFLAVPALIMVMGSSPAHFPGIGLALAVVGAGTSARLAEMAFDISDEASALDYSLLLTPELWVAAVRPVLVQPDNAQYYSVLMSASLTSPLVPLLALVGVATQKRRLALWLGFWWVATLVPVLPKAWPLADAFRLQAASLVPVVVLAGLGLEVLVEKWRARQSERPVPGVLLWLGLGFVIAPQLVIDRPTWGTLDEARLFLAATPTLEPTATILVDSTHQHSSSLPQWGSLAAPGTRWLPIPDSSDELEPTTPLMAWVGSSCTDEGDGLFSAGQPTRACERLRAACTLRPATVETIPLTGDVSQVFQQDEAHVGFYYLDDCDFSRESRPDDRPNAPAAPQSTEPAAPDSPLTAPSQPAAD